MKILIVDDEFSILVIARKILEAQDHIVFTAENGVEALDIIRSEDIQVVISDWNMPEMDGLELCRFLREQPMVNHLFFIMMTSRDSHADKMEASKAGANEILTKPIDAGELQVRLRSAEHFLNMPSLAKVIKGMAKMAEAKDLDTGLHLIHIQHYSRALTLEMLKLPGLKEQLPVHFADLIFDASPAHDLGKVSIPDYVLFKPESLNDAEWKIMKSHAEDGAERLDSLLEDLPKPDIISIARDIARAHHERWDGTGYPQGLRGEHIPICARIVALADVYDALTMKRVYKAAMSHDVAREIILKSSGTHFDPQVVLAFLAAEARFIEIRNQFCP